MMEKEQRSEYRLADTITIFIETFSAPAGESRLANSIVISKTIDVSANGIQVVMDKPLPLGSILQFCLETKGGDERFHLAGEVMWLSETAQQKQYLVGFKILDAEQTHISEWKQYICQRLGEAGDGLDISPESFL